MLKDMRRIRMTMCHDSQPGSASSNRVVVDLFQTLGIKCGIAIHRDKLTESQIMTTGLVEDAVIDAQDTIKFYMEKYVGMSQKELISKQDSRMMMELVQFLCLRQDRGLELKFIDVDVDFGVDIADDDVRLVPS